MSQLFTQGTAPGQPQFVKAFSNARKLFQIAKLPFGALAYGAGNIGNKSIESLLDEFNQRREIREDRPYSVQEVAGKLLAFIRSPYESAFGGSAPEQRPLLGFYLAGYSPAQHLGNEWEFILPSDTAPRQARPDDQVGANWRGIALPFVRLHSGVDPRLFEILQAQGLDNNVIESVRAAAQGLVSQVVFDGMPLKDAIGFCRFILETTINTSTYEAGVPSCGGPLQIAIITRTDGFAWVAKPSYSL